MKRLRPLTRALTTLAVTITTALAAVLVPATAQAATVRYVALGDSYSSGVGAGPYDFSTCLRSPNSYAPMWATDRLIDSFEFPACGGAITADVLNKQLGPLNTGTTMVTITIGGNDIGFAEVVSTCQFSTDSGCLTSVNEKKAFTQNVLPGRLDQTYAAIRNRAPNARIIVLGYPRLFEETSSCGLFTMNLYKRKLLNTSADLLASVIAGRAAAAGITYVDVRSRFAGHGICSSSSWIHNVTGAIEAFHPRYEGYKYGYLPALESVVG